MDPSSAPGADPHPAPGLGAHTGAMAGLRVVDLSRVLAGPLCTQMLADHGAEVIKIEPPSGDETRTLGPPFNADGDAAYYTAVNRGKRSLALDLSHPEGRAVLLRLLQHADVLVDNFLPGTLERWGLGYDAVLRPRFPRLVYCAISGFGPDGPLGGLPGYDAVLQALCGLMSINGSPASGPTRIGIPLVDHVTGYTAAMGILMALLARTRSGCGQRVDATLFDTALSLLVPHAANWMHSGREPQLLGSAHPNIAPYDAFACRDGQVFLGIVNDRQFRRLCEHLGLPALAGDARFATNAARVQHRDALRQALEATLATHDRAALCQALMQQGVPAGAVHTVPEALQQPHAAHRRMAVEAGPYRGLGLPVRLSRTPGRPGQAPPRFAEHADDVLLEAGLSREHLAELRALGVLAAPRRAP